MSFDWIQYIYVAQKTIEEIPDQEPDEEAKCRNAISRAYYAVFCHAEIYLFKRNNIKIKFRTIIKRGKKRKEGYHEAVIRTLLENSVGKQNELIKLYDLKTLRNEADYNDKNKFFTSQSRKDNTLLHIENCKKLIDVIKKLP
jgi:uncharacterized protein (UPF0332 family)